MKEKLLVEIDRGFEVEIRGERPETDEGGREKIKKRKVGLKDTDDKLLDFRDTWVTVEDEKVEMGQRESSQVERGTTRVEQKNSKKVFFPPHLRLCVSSPHYRTCGARAVLAASLLEIKKNLNLKK
jgi:hypothetical protein